MSVKDDDKPQLADSSKEAGGESSLEMEPLLSEMLVGSFSERRATVVIGEGRAHIMDTKIEVLAKEPKKVMDKKTQPGLRIPRSETDILEETLRLEKQEEEMYKRSYHESRILQHEIDEVEARVNTLKGQSQVGSETDDDDDDLAEELKAKLNRLKEQRKKMYERIHRESKILRSMIDTLKGSLNILKEQRKKMDKKTYPGSKISRSETDIMEETLNRLIKQKEQMYEKTYHESQFLRREIDRLEGRSRFVLEGFHDEQAEDEAELNRLKEQRQKMYERTYHESKILRSVIDTLKESLNKPKGQKKKWNVWTDGEPMWSGVDRAFQRIELRTKWGLLFDDEWKWLYVDRAFQNTEFHLRRRRFSDEPMLIEKPHTSRFDDDFGSYVSLGPHISRRHDIHRGKFHHDILGELNVTFKLVDRSKRLDVGNYFLNPLHHPNILKCIETGFLYQWIYIAMEECHYQNLHDFVQFQILTGVPFDSDKYLLYSYQLALGVQYLHCHKTYVKNLMPDAILLSVDKTTVKICDFGPIAEIKTSSVAENLDCDEISNDIHSLGFVFHYLWSYKKLKIRDFPPNPSLATEDPILVPNPMLARSLLEHMLSEDSTDRPSAEEVMQHEIFNPFRKSVSDDECISPDEMSDVVDEMEKLDVSEGDVTTEIRDVSSGIAVSQTIDKFIPMEGDLVEVGGCFVTFPPDSFDEPSDVKIKAEIDSSKWPHNFTGYTPTLYVTAKGLRKKLHLKLPSWRVTTGSQYAKAFVLHKWEYTDTTLPVPVNSDPYFEFDWGDFSPIAVGNTPMEAKSTARRISGAVFVSEDAQVSVVFHINDQSSSDANSSIIQKISEQMAILVPPRHLTIRLTPFTAEENEEIQTHVSCKQPSELSFDPADPFTFTIDEEFGETLELNGSVLGELSEKQRIVLNCKVQRANGVKIGNTSSFTCNWRPTERKAVKRKRSSKQGDDHVLLKIDKRVMVADSMADHGARIKSKESDKNVDIAYRAPAEEEQIDESDSD